MVAESWFRSFWKPSKKHDPVLEKAVIGVLAFEIASLMSKLIHLWNSLSDKQVNRLREEISKSVGVKKLISDDDEHIGRLIWAEMVDNVVQVASSVARLGKKCNDPSLKLFEQAFKAWVSLGVDQNGWVFTRKKMERKVKKMEKFVSLNASLYQEMEVLADLEQSLGRMKDSDQPEAASGLSEFQKKVTWKQHEVRTLKEVSLWNRSYDYAILLLARSLFTAFHRIKHVFGFAKVAGAREVAAGDDYSGQFSPRRHPPPPRNNVQPRFTSGPLGNAAENSGQFKKPGSKINNFYSGPLDVGAKPDAAPAAAPGKSRGVFYSGPLGGSRRSLAAVAKSGPLFSGMSKYGKKIWQSGGGTPKSGRLTQVGPFKVGPAGDALLRQDGAGGKLSVAGPETLGAAALALHYANVVVVLEKLAGSPHLIGLDARDDLYGMLPASLRSLLREKLRPFRKIPESCDAVLAREWTEAMAAILEWLGPLAHNTIRWQSERSFEQQTSAGKGGHVLLVQTLHYANQEKTEAMIAELLVGLNYIWRFGREVNSKAMIDCGSSRIYDQFLDNLDG